MNKELSHRSDELKKLGWNQEDITRYEELWEYTQRWGLINLEREDRQFLKKAQKLIPKLQPKKISTKKSIEEKTYYLWLDFYLAQMINFNKKYLSKGEESVWKIMLEEELDLLRRYKPVMGLPDTIKAKQLCNVRNEILRESIDQLNCKNSKNLFDFESTLNFAHENKSRSWKSIIENSPDDKNFYPVFEGKDNLKIKKFIKDKIEAFMVCNYPSLKENL